MSIVGMTVSVAHTRIIVLEEQTTPTSTPTYATIGNYIVGIDFKSGSAFNPANKLTELADHLLRCDTGLDIQTGDLITETNGTQYKIEFKHRNNDVPISFDNFDVFGMSLLGA